MIQKPNLLKLYFKILSYKNCGEYSNSNNMFEFSVEKCKKKNKKKTEFIFMWQKLCNIVLLTSDCYKMWNTVLKVLFYKKVKLHAFSLLNVIYTHVIGTKDGCFILLLCQFLRLYSVDCRLMTYEHGELVELESQGKTDVLGRVSVPVPTNPTQFDLRSNPRPRMWAWRPTELCMVRIP